MHAYTPKMNAAKLRIVFVKKMRPSYNFLFFSFTHLFADSTYATKFDTFRVSGMALPWFSIIRWHSHFSKSCQASAAVFGDGDAVAADLLESLMIFHSICWMQNANASAQNANRRIRFMVGIDYMCVCVFFSFVEICDCHTVRCISAFDVSLNFRR